MGTPRTWAERRPSPRPRSRGCKRRGPRPGRHGGRLGGGERSARPGAAPRGQDARGGRGASAGGRGAQRAVTSGWRAHGRSAPSRTATGGGGRRRSPTSRPAGPLGKGAACGWRAAAAGARGRGGVHKGGPAGGGGGLRSGAPAGRGEGPRLYPWGLLFPGTLGGKREAFVTITLAFALSADGGPGTGLFPGPHTGIRLAASGSRSQCVRTSGASWHRARLRPPRLGVTCSPGPAPGPREGLRPEPGSGIGCLSSWCYLCLSFVRAGF